VSHYECPFVENFLKMIMKIRDSGYYSDVSLEIPFRKCLKRVPPIKLRVHNFLMPKILDVLSILIWEKPLKSR
jgi:hypothetical protein